MGPEAYAIVELFKKRICFTKTVPKIAGKVPDTVYKHSEVWRTKRRGFLLCVSLYKGAMLFPEFFPAFLSSIGTLGRKINKPF